LGKSVHLNRPDKKHRLGFGLPPAVVKQVCCIATQCQRAIQPELSRLGKGLSALREENRSIPNEQVMLQQSGGNQCLQIVAQQRQRAAMTLIDIDFMRH